ncbi:MAG: RimK/LysX family protein [Pseudomonadota bacterium]
MKTELIKLGWEEWLSLPDLSLPAIQAKIDTGARTSALHATQIEQFGSDVNPKLRFLVHPVPGNNSIATRCTAVMKDRREVTSSNGEKELRFVIETRVRFGETEWPIEVTLTDRSGMAYPMLLGRMALVDHCVVVPGESHQQPDLSYDVYDTAPAEEHSKRALRIALLTGKSEAPSARMLYDEGEARGHTIEALDPAHLTLTTSATTPQLHRYGKDLPLYDAVIPRMPATTYNAALLRQFQALGAYTPNTADGLLNAHEPMRAQQLLAHNHIAIADTTFPLTSRYLQPEDIIEVLVIGGKLTVTTRDGKKAMKLTSEERKTALRAARVFHLEFVALSLRRTPDGLQVLDLTSRPDMARVLALTRKSPAPALFDLIERKTPPRARQD